MHIATLALFLNVLESICFDYVLICEDIPGWMWTYAGKKRLISATKL